MKIDTYQKKFICTAVGLLIILLLSWNMAIRPTWTCLTELNEVNKEMTSSDISEKTVADLEKQLSDIRLTHTAAQDPLKSELIFKKISDISELGSQVKILQFPEVHLTKLNDYQIGTMKLELEGSFQNLVRFIFDLENEPSIGGIASIHFYLDKDFKLNKESLRLDILIQNFKKM